MCYKRCLRQTFDEKKQVMKNILSVSSKKRDVLLLAGIFAMLFLILGLTILGIFEIQLKKDFNGKTQTVTGTVTNVDTRNGIHLTLNDGVTYNCNMVNELSDWSVIIGKTATLVTSQESIDVAKHFVLGIDVDEILFVDYKETLDYQTEKCSIGRTVCAIVAGVFACVACTLFVCMIRTPKLKDVPLTPYFANVQTVELPFQSRYRIWTVTVAVLSSVFLVALFAVATQKELDITAWALTLIALILVVAFPQILFYLRKRKFYRENYPFDIDRLLRVTARQQNNEVFVYALKNARKISSHRYFDAGNDLLVEFNVEGVELLRCEFCADGDYACASYDDSIVLPYNKLNFEAVFFVTTTEPFVVVIKSRLPEEGNYPEILTNDLHFCLSKNLLETLETFNVPVENLHQILDNKEAYMKEYSFRKKRK